jgi:ribA/ribD-fused uncharacterized protein
LHGFDKEKWHANAEKVCREANKMKYMQNRNLLGILKTSHPLKLYEATFDTFWGSGVGLKEIGKKTLTGKNIQGTVLMELRDTLELG